MTLLFASQKPLSASDLTLFDRLRRPVWLASPDDGRFHWGNPAALALWDVPDVAAFRRLPPLSELACGHGQAGPLHRGETIEKQVGIRGRRIGCLLSMVALEDAGDVILAEGVAEGAPLPQAVPAAGSATRRLLAVEDNPVSRKVLEAMLRSLGHDVTAVADGAAAVAAAAAQCFDLILMDMQLPDMDGIAAMGLIRALPPPHGLAPVFCITAETGDTAETRCRRAGVAGFAPKPLDKTKLAAIIAAHALAQSGYDPAILRGLAETLDPGSLDRILTTFMTDADRRMAMMAAAFDGGDWAEINRQAHSIAGAASQFGLTDLSVLCRNLCGQVESGAAACELEQTFARLRDVIPAARRYLTFALASRN